MPLHIIGLGLADENDITVKGLALVKAADFVYIETYTSILLVPKATLEAAWGKELIEADREVVESGCEEMLQRAASGSVALLIVGDPFSATTHTDLFLRARERGIVVTIVHNASILNAIGSTGLQLYRFGETVSLPFFTENWKPYSFYDKVSANISLGLHTLVLLDIKVKEASEENLARGRMIYEPPRFMSASTAAQQILETEAATQKCLVTPATKVVAVARMGAET